MWIYRGYDLVYKLCTCDCGHGHIKKDLEEEKFVLASKSSEEKKKKEKVNLKPKLNLPMDKVSEQRHFGSWKERKVGQLTPSQQREEREQDQDEAVSSPAARPSSGLSLSSYLPPEQEQPSVETVTDLGTWALATPFRKEEGDWLASASGRLATLLTPRNGSQSSSLGTGFRKEEGERWESAPSQSYQQADLFSAGSASLGGASQSSSLGAWAQGAPGEDLYQSEEEGDCDSKEPGEEETFPLMGSSKSEQELLWRVAKLEKELRGEQTAKREAGEALEQLRCARVAQEKDKIREMAGWKKETGNLVAKLERLEEDHKQKVAYIMQVAEAAHIKEEAMIVEVARLQKEVGAEREVKELAGQKVLVLRQEKLRLEDRAKDERDRFQAILQQNMMNKEVVNQEVDFKGLVTAFDDEMCKVGKMIVKNRNEMIAKIMVLEGKVSGVSKKVINLMSEANFLPQKVAVKEDSNNNFDSEAPFKELDGNSEEGSSIKIDSLNQKLSELEKVCENMTALQKQLVEEMAVGRQVGELNREETRELRDSVARLEGQVGNMVEMSEDPNTPANQTHEDPGNCSGMLWILD